MKRTVLLLASMALAVLLAAGVALAQSTAADTKAPRVTEVRPAEGATGVSPFDRCCPSESHRVVAYFSEDMRERSVWQAFKLFRKGSDTPFANYAVRYNAAQRKATLWPETPLRRGATYKAVVSTRAEDLAGNRLDQNRNRAGLQPKVWYFTIEDRSDGGNANGGNKGRDKGRDKGRCGVKAVAGSGGAKGCVGGVKAIVR